MAQYAAYKTAAPMMEKRPDFLASHPSTPERVEFAMRAAREFGAPGLGEVDRDRYLAGIDGLIFGDDPSQGYVRERTFIHPTLGVGFTVPDGFVIDNASDAVLATGADGTALRFDAVALVRGADLGQYLASGWVNGLNETSVTRFTVNGMPAAAAHASAKGWEFRIAIVQADSGATYRFIFANEFGDPRPREGRRRDRGELPPARPAGAREPQAADHQDRHGAGRRHRSLGDAGGRGHTPAILREPRCHLVLGPAKSQVLGLHNPGPQRSPLTTNASISPSSSGTFSFKFSRFCSVASHPVRSYQFCRQLCFELCANRITTGACEPAGHNGLPKLIVERSVHQTCKAIHRGVRYHERRHNELRVVALIQREQWTIDERPRAIELANVKIVCG